MVLKEPVCPDDEDDARADSMPGVRWTATQDAGGDPPSVEDMCRPLSPFVLRSRDRMAVLVPSAAAQQPQLWLLIRNYN